MIHGSLNLFICLALSLELEGYDGSIKLLYDSGSFFFLEIIFRLTGDYQVYLTTLDLLYVTFLRTDDFSLLTIF